LEGILHFRAGEGGLIIMAEAGRKRVDQEAIDEEQRKAAEEAAKNAPEPERLGDVLGLSDASPAVEIPRATDDRGGNPAGIEVREPASGTGELHRGKGVTGIQMGGAGEGTDIAPDAKRPAQRETND
jgi:hypothetical protein